MLSPLSPLLPLLGLGLGLSAPPLALSSGPLLPPPAQPQGLEAPGPGAWEGMQGVVVGAAVHGPGAGVTAFPAPDPEAIPQIVRIPQGERIQIDGYLDEAAWERALALTDFTQQEPVEGGVPSEPTEVRLLLDRDALYIGAIFHDSNPAGIIGHQRRRNAGLGSDDRFMWVLDTFLDGRTGYFFETNPAGLMGDGIILPGSGMSVNKSWDGIWEVRTRIHDWGWTAEIRIPFSTLNFDPELDTWGINFQRTIRRRNEEIVWRGWRRNQPLTRPIHAGRVGGIQEVSQGLGLELRPYLTTSGDQAPPLGTDWDGRAKTGFDLTWSATPGLRAAFSVNTDFAEVEVDDRRVNLTRFPLRFPERRDFFLEGSGVFSFAPSSGPSPFFSRRIGLVAGEEVPLRAGGRLVGQVGRQEVGFYQIRTGATTLAGDQPLPAEDFTVARLKRALFAQSHLGAVYTRRADVGGDAARPDRHTVGVDADFFTSAFLGRYNAQVEAFYVAHTDPAEGGWERIRERQTRGVRVNFPNGLVRFHASLRDFGVAYDPAVGFSSRRGYRRTQPTLTLAPRPASLASVREIQTQLFFEYLTDLDNRLLVRTLRLTPLQVDFETGDRLSLGLERKFERLDAPFVVYRAAEGPVVIEAGDYPMGGWEVEARSAGRRAVFANASYGVEDFWSGRRRSLSGAVSARPVPGVEFGLSGGRNEVRLPQGNFDTNLLRLSGAWDASPLLSFSGNVQFDDVSDVLGLFARARWIVRPGSDLFLVWTHNWRQEEEGGDLLDPRSRRFETLSRGGALKLNYAIRF